MDSDAQFLYVGVKGKAEATIVPKRGYDIAYVTSRGWPGAKIRPALFLFIVMFVTAAVSPALAGGGFFERGEVLVESDAREYRSARDRGPRALAWELPVSLTGRAL